MDGTMSKKSVEEALARGVDIFNEFLPVKSLLVFPLLYSACVWAVRRVFDYRERIFSWQIWLDPEEVRTKPDDFILHFFATHAALSRVYADEIASLDRKALRRAFPALYPVCGLEDAFLKGLFRQELAAGDYRRIAAEFESRAAKARADIRIVEANPEFWKALEGFGLEIASLGIHLLSDEAVQDMIVAAVKKAMSRKAKG
jgi:hypothetical protein